LLGAAIAFSFESIRDRRLTKDADRKKHLERIREEVLEKMIEKLASYRSSIYRNIGGWEIPISLRRSEPTSSKLFETLELHFPKVKTDWDNFERKMESFGEGSTALYQLIENLLAKQHNVSFQRLAEFSDRDLAQHVCIDFFGRLVNPKEDRGPADVITVEPYEEKWLIEHPRGNFFVDGDDRESLDAAKVIRYSLQSYANSPDLRKPAAEIAQNYAVLLEDSKKLESLIRDAMARSKLEGKCKYCP